MNMAQPLVSLVSTVRSVLAVDIHTGRYEVIERGRGLYYGLARRSGRPMVAARREALPEEGRRPISAATLIELGPDGNEGLEPPLPLRDVHQMVDHQGTLLIVCSFDEQVVIRTDRNIWHTWHPFPRSNTDQHHLNSIRVIDDVVHVLAHNWDQPSEILSYRWPNLDALSPHDPGTVCEITLKPLGSMKVGRMAHDIWMHDDEIAVSSSADGAIKWRDGRQVEIGGFVRGLSITPDRIIVGRSLDAPRNLRSSADAHLVVFDRNWTHLRDIILPGEGMVLDLRTPGHADECDGDHDDAPWPFSPRGGWHRLPVKPAPR